MKFLAGPLWGTRLWQRPGLTISSCSQSSHRQLRLNPCRTKASESCSLQQFHTEHSTVLYLSTSNLRTTSKLTRTLISQVSPLLSVLLSVMIVSRHRAFRTSRHIREAANTVRIDRDTTDGEEETECEERKFYNSQPAVFYSISSKSKCYQWKLKTFKTPSLTYNILSKQGPSEQGHRKLKPCPAQQNISWSLLPKLVIVSNSSKSTYLTF